MDTTSKGKTAYAYLRVSGRGQVSGDGFDRQLETINRFAAGNNVEIVHVYKDAYTGKEDDRPQYMQMLEAMMENGVKTIVVECLDRLARDLMVQSLLLAKLESEGLILYNAMTGEDVTAAMREDPMRKAMVQIQGVFAELDRNLVVRKLRRARQRKKARTGGREGKEGIKVYGSKPGEEGGLRRIQELVVRNLGPTAIAKQLNVERVPSRSGKPWSKQAVFGIRKRLLAAESDRVQALSQEIETEPV